MITFKSNESSNIQSFSLSKHIRYSFTVSQQENTLYDDSEKTQSSSLILITHIISNTLTHLLMNTTNVHLSHFGVNIKALY